MKKIMLAIFTCIVFAITSFSQKTDSTYSEVKTNGVWQKNELDIITRNANCDVTSLLQTTWNASTDSWVNSMLSSYSTNANNVAIVFTQSWDALNNIWINNSRSFFKIAGFTRTYEYQVWDAGSSTWMSNYKISDDLDKQGRTIVSEFDLYSNNQLQKIQRSLLTYTAEGFVASSTFQMWTNNAWINNSKTTYDYTGNGLTTQYSWANNTWIVFARAFNKYITNTALAVKSFGQYLSGTVWQNSFQATQSFNDANLQLSSFQQIWDAGNNAWVNSFRDSLNYYADNNPDHALYENWDGNTNSWSSGFRTTNTDISCSTSVQLVPVTIIKNNMAVLQQKINNSYVLRRLPSIKTNKIIEKRFNPMASNAHMLVYDINFNNQKQSQQSAYELIISFGEKSHSVSNATVNNVVETNKHGFTLSPNPAKNYFNINLSDYKNEGSITIKLSDLTGKTIIQQKVNAGLQKINLPSLQKGVYVVTVISGKEIQTQKLVVE